MTIRYGTEADRAEILRLSPHAEAVMPSGEGSGVLIAGDDGKLRGFAAVTVGGRVVGSCVTYVLDNPG